MNKKRTKTKWKMDEDERKDPQIREFLSKDLSEDMKSWPTQRITPKYRQRLTSIYLDPALVNELRAKAAKRGMGYQTLLKMIVHDHIKEY